MIIEAIVHEPIREFVYPVKRNILHFKLRSARNDIKECKLIYWNRYHMKDTGGELKAEMKCFARDARFDYFEIEVQFSEAARYIKYFFEVSDGRDRVWLNSKGIIREKPNDGFFEYLYANERDVFTVPAWAEGAVYYQIFPERFYNGDTSNDPQEVTEWRSEPTRENFMGGDLKGIIKKLDYISDLGVDIIYLNPIFSSPSNHKYDTVDYCTVDSSFGSTDDLKQFVDECHYRNIKVILDGVFNHCGFYFPPFQDVIKSGKDSVYKDWFLIDQYPVITDPPNYECVGYYKWMPKLRTSNPKVREYIFEAVTYWMRETGIDGWRLDVADEMEFVFWQEFRHRIKEINREAMLLGETWKDARDMLRGDQMDSVMNYIFKDAVTDFFAKSKITVREFDSRINSMLALYPKHINHVLYNLIGSHDTERFLTSCNDDVRKLKLAVAFQMTFLGSPAVLYGDEIGLTGENDPGCRKAMVWDEKLWDNEILDWFKKLIRLRKENQALSHGSFMSILCEEESDVYGYIRCIDNDAFYIAVNNSDSEARVELPVCEKLDEGWEYRDWIDGSVYKAEEIGEADMLRFYNSDLLNYQGKIKLYLPGCGISIIKK